MSFSPCPMCGSTDSCESTCVLSGPMNEMRSRRIRVYIDEAGDQFLNFDDIDKVVRSHLALTQAANGPLNPVTRLTCSAIASFASILMSATIPDCEIRVLVSDIDTSVPDVVPAEWLNDAPGGQT